MLISIVIVTYNSSRFIRNCINSILKYKNIEIIVVDNNSEDKTVDILKKEFPEVKLIANKENVGFAKACNLGAKFSKGDFLFFLNPDTEIINGDLEKFVDYLKKNKDIGILGPKLIFPDGKLQRSYFPMFNLWWLFLKLFYLEKIFLKNFNDKEKEVEMLTGAAILLRRKDFFLVNGFDENFPLYFEDFDLSRKIKKTGKSIYYYPYLTLVHHGGASAKLDDFLSRSLGRKSLNYYIKKYYGFLGVILLFFMLVFRFLINKFIFKFICLIFNKPENFKILDKNTTLWLKEFFKW